MDIPDSTSVMTDEDATQSEPVKTGESAAVSAKLLLRWCHKLAPWWQAMLAVLPVFLITRFIFLLLTYFGSVLFTVKNYAFTVVPLHTVLSNWDRWDAGNFEYIAVHGYSNADPTLAAFFPLYPWLEREVALLLHIHHSFFLAGMLISNIAFFGMLIVLYRFVEVEFDRDTAGRTALYVAVFPTALFFFAAYNESLFLFFLLLSFYAMRHRSWWLAGLFGGLATLTRSIGIVLLVIFLFEFIRQDFPFIRAAWLEKQPMQVLKLLSGLLAAPLIPLGLAIFAFYLNLRMHDPLAFSHAEVQWHLGPTTPWYAPVVAIRSMLHFSPFTFSTTHNVIDMTALFLFIILLILCFVGPERFAVGQWSMPLFGIIAISFFLIFPGTANNPLPSMERYVLEIFPAFIMLARFGRRPWFHQSYLLLSLPMLAFLTLQFLTGHWTI